MFRRGIAWVAGAALVVGGPIAAQGSPRGEGNPAASVSADGVLVPRGAELRYHVVRSAPLAASIGAAVVGGHDAVAGRRTEVPSGLGEGRVPPGFPAGLDDVATGAMPLAARDRRACDCATEIGDTRKERITALYATRTFRVDDPTRLASLEIGASYRDGIAIYLNGIEVARRNLPARREGAELAERPRGPEWERFFVPVVPGVVRPGDNVLAVEVRPSGRRAAPELDLEVRAVPAARLVRGPVVQRHDGGLVIVRFTTDVPVRGAVEWGTGEDMELDRSAPSAGGALATEHRVVLRGVATDQPFRYRIRAGDAASSLHAVPAWPRPGRMVRFAVYGDMRGGHDVHARITEAIESEAPDFVIVTGDLVLRGSDAGDWQRFFDVAGQLLARTTYLPVAGNHDIGFSGQERRRMNELFEFPPPPPGRPEWGNWYSVDVADLHLVMLDSNAYDHPAQLTWLEKDLADARARGVRAIFAAMHDGPYSRGIHRGNRVAQSRFAPVLAEAGVAMMFSGHDHLYQRGEVAGLRYIVSGGGGAPLYPVRCGKRGKPRCPWPDGMQHVESTYHYVLVTVREQLVEVCPKRPDGTLVERCTRFTLPARK